VPVATGVTVMFGAMGVLGVTINLFNIVASVLIIGICVDYGIFIVASSDAGVEPGAARAVLVSGLTTIAGVGVLVLAKHPALRSIGLTVLLGLPRCGRAVGHPGPGAAVSGRRGASLASGRAVLPPVSMRRANGGPRPARPPGPSAVWRIRQVLIEFRKARFPVQGYLGWTR
jgi:hypothetical protein